MNGNNVNNGINNNIDNSINNNVSANMNINNMNVSNNDNNINNSVNGTNINNNVSNNLKNKLDFKKVLLIAGILFILLIPIKKTYKDGGTREYSAILYKVIKWHILDDDYESGYNDSTEIHIFPTNFHGIDYYKKIKPISLYIMNHNKTKRVKANTGSYSWCVLDINNNLTNTCEVAEKDSPVDMNYKETLSVKRNEKIYHNNDMKVSKVEVYSDGKLNRLLDYIEYEKAIRINLEKGDYIIAIHAEYTEGNVCYSLKIHVE